MLNPDMDIEELRLHMGELTHEEALVARAAIRWSNSQKENMKICSKNHPQIVFDDSDNPEGAEVCPLCHYSKAANELENELMRVRAELLELKKQNINFFYEKTK